MDKNVAGPKHLGALAGLGWVAMKSERLFMGIATLVLGLFALVLWGDYLTHSDEVYGERDAAQARISQIDNQLASATDAEQIFELNDERTVAEGLRSEAERRINEMDGWTAPEWKVKNSLRLATPAFAALFGAFLVLSILKPMRN